MPANPPPMSALKVAKLVDALGGGIYADAADRARAEAILRRFPLLPGQIDAARRCHAEAALRAVTVHGARGVIFGAARFPAEPYPHTAALAAVPEARFAYIHGDARVTWYNRRLLGAPNVAACEGRLRDPEGLMGLPEVRALGAPLMLQCQLAAHYWTDAQGRALVSAYGRLLPPGSSLMLTCGIPDDTPAGREWAALLSAASGEPVQCHTPEDIAAWLEHAGMEQDGPVTDVRAYGRPWAQAELPREPPGRIVAVTGCLPRRR